MKVYQAEFSEVKVHEPCEQKKNAQLTNRTYAKLRKP